ncbi:Putative small multi-drug export protein [Salinibacillus kushneri]|uniref:Putative small multi-drug export protein n=1 Tax=Salinibacillus kushneri TaxID=237682 RepID=A0A1I0F6A1_9BACI|nr:small multi-drug export protein [Salinibacillus kushneri]SET53642.1 Putative small multi-drug export protein [Salinibacillus kushneri]
MKLLWAYTLVFILSATPFLEAYGIIPVAAIAGLSITVVMVLGLVGNILTVLLVILFINQIKTWRKKKRVERKHKESKRSVRAQNLWKKFGLPGLAIFGPLFVGSHLTALFSMSLGGTKKKTFAWMAASITTWSIAFTVLLQSGIDLMNIENRGLINYFKMNQ